MIFKNGSIRDLTPLPFENVIFYYLYKGNFIRLKIYINLKYK